MDWSSHLLLADENYALAHSLSAAAGESSWRWAVVVAFYAGHHYVHALFDRYSDSLPKDELRSGRHQAQRISYVHPRFHGSTAGGTKDSLALLTGQRTEFDPLNRPLAMLLQDSHTARYGRSGMTFVRFTQDDARRSLDLLDDIVSIISPHLR